MVVRRLLICNCLAYRGFDKQRFAIPSQHMKQLKTILTVATILIGNLFLAKAQGPVGKNLHQVIAMWGSNFTKLHDAQGLHVLEYKKLVAKDTVTDLLYFEGFTCVKEVSLRPANEKSQYTDSLNRQFTPINSTSWLSKDSTFITVATSDGFLDITSFSAAYYRKLAH